MGCRCFAVVVRFMGSDLLTKNARLLSFGHNPPFLHLLGAGIAFHDCSVCIPTQHANGSPHRTFNEPASELACGQFVSTQPCVDMTMSVRGIRNGSGLSAIAPMSPAWKICSRGDRRGTPKRRRWRPLKTPCTAQLTARGQSGLARRLPQHLTDLLGPVVGSTIRRSSEVGTLLSNRSRVTIGCAGGHGSKPTNIESTSSAAKVYL